MIRWIVDDADGAVGFPAELLGARVLQPQEFIDQAVNMNEDSYVIIHVNLKCKYSQRQANAGMQLWRQALRSGLKASVAFVSFISREECVRLSKGRDVILLYEEFVPFRRLPVDRLDFSSGPKFSFLCEDLLSGWGISVAERNTLDSFTREEFERHGVGRGKKALLIDDKYADWSKVLKTVFDIDLSCSESTEWQKLFEAENRESINTALANTRKWFEQNRKQIHQNDFIFLDLFLVPAVERHDRDRRLSKEDLSQLSGSRVLDQLKLVDPSVPVAMFTVSSRSWNYKRLSQIGAEEWWAKSHSRESVPGNGEKKDSYNELAEIVDKLLQSPYPEQRKIYISLRDVNSKLERPTETLRGLPPGLNPTAGGQSSLQELRHQISNILKQSFDSLRAMSSVGIGGNLDSYVHSAIVNQLGKIPEIVSDVSGSGAYQNPYFEAARHLRNRASHALHYSWFDVFDSRLMFRLCLMGMEDTSGRCDFFIPNPKDGFCGEALQKCIYALTYVAIYNFFYKSAEIRYLCDAKKSIVQDSLSGIDSNELAVQMVHYFNNCQRSYKKTMVDRIAIYNGSDTKVRLMACGSKPVLWALGVSTWNLPQSFQSQFSNEGIQFISI
ncbi:hypothetical protein L0156_10345 [bacterium]|nr:hypothetical protein [bacterium]